MLWFCEKKTRIKNENKGLTNALTKEIVELKKTIKQLENELVDETNIKKKLECKISEIKQLV